MSRWGGVAAVAAVAAVASLSAALAGGGAVHTGTRISENAVPSATAGIHAPQQSATWPRASHIQMQSVLQGRAPSSASSTASSTASSPPSTATGSAPANTSTASRASSSWDQAEPWGGWSTGTAWEEARRSLLTEQAIKTPHPAALGPLRWRLPCQALGIQVAPGAISTMGYQFALSTEAARSATDHLMYASAPDVTASGPWQPHADRAGWSRSFTVPNEGTVYHWTLTALGAQQIGACLSLWDRRSARR